MEVKTMSKPGLSFLAKALADKSELNPAEAEVFIKQMFDVVNYALNSDKQLKVRWLGTFKVTSTKDRESIDVNTGERILIEGRDKLSFTPDSILKELVNKPFAQFETVVVNDGVDFTAIDEKFELQDNVRIDAKEDTEHEIEKFTDVVCVTDENSSPITESSGTEISDEVVVIGENEPTEQSTIPTKPTPTLVEEQVETDRQTTNEQQATASVVSKKRHISIPRYMFVAVSLFILLMFGGLCWLAYNYGKIAAQRDGLALQIKSLEQQHDIRLQKRSEDKVKEKEILRQKALADSVRMARASEALEVAEQTSEIEEDAVDKPANKKISLKEENVAESNLSKEAYDQDPRVRTGAYRIIGVAQVVTVKEGQTLASISKRYLGEGMECYIEALNGTSQVRAGQQLKIPKLKIKKK